MEETTQEVRKDKVYADGTAVTEKRVSASSSEDGAITAQRIVNLIVGIVLALHAIRFLLSLFGANRSNGFADFIYTITAPFVAPFRGLFSVDTRVGESARFEIETIVAAVVYALIGWLIIKVIGVARKSETHTAV